MEVVQGQVVTGPVPVGPTQQTFAGVQLQITLCAGSQSVAGRVREVPSANSATYSIAAGGSTINIYSPSPLSQLGVYLGWVDPDGGIHQTPIQGVTLANWYALADGATILFA